MAPVSPPEPVQISLLVERQFLPDCCTGKSYEYGQSFRAAVRLWGADLGREAVTTDFTVDGIARFTRHLRHAGYSVESIRRCRTRLLTLWRYAHRRGLAPRCETVKVDRRPALVELPSSDRLARPPRVLINGFDLPAAPGTFRHYFETVFLQQQLLSCTPGHVGDHKGIHRSLWQHYHRDILLEEQTDALAADHFAWMKKQGKTNWAINNFRKNWFTQWRHAAERGHVSRTPLIRPLRVERGAPDAWTVDELKRIVNVATPWWRALILVGYSTLVRRRALFSIPPECVDLDGGQIDFPASSIKTRTGLRCRIGPDAVEALRAIWPPRGHVVFERPSDLDKQFRQLIAAADVRPSRRKNCYFHKLRRTGATHGVIRGGMAVICDLLGQSSIYVTKRYVDTSQLPSHDATRLLPSLFEASPLQERSPS